MKIKTAQMSYEDVLAIPPSPHRMPRRPGILFRMLLRAVSAPELRDTHFVCRRTGMEKLGKKEPCLILMNHSGFIDLKIAESVFYPRPLSIVCTSDGFVGKEWLMRRVGCIPTKKFVPELALVRDMLYALRRLGSSVLMYPEASYTFDGTATPLPESLGRCLKMLSVPVITVRTYGAFAHDPLYNNLQQRQVNVSADVEYFLSPADIESRTAEELNNLLREKFTFDNFRWQEENSVRISEPFRADCLNRVLFKCPHCLAEGHMAGSGTKLVCGSCGKEYELTEYGALRAADGNTEFAHIPDWYSWERECVRREIENGTYRIDVPVDIYIMADMKRIYRVGEGELVHSCGGFHLTGCGGRLDYTQKPLASYGLYADYNWYEIGDMICIGSEILYYCFPKCGGDVVSKARLAAEELYRSGRAKKRQSTEGKTMPQNGRVLQKSV